MVEFYVHYEDSDKGTIFGIDILYYPEECDDKGELIKAGHYLGELHC